MAVDHKNSIPLGEIFVNPPFRLAQGRIQSQYWLCEDSDFFPDFVGDFFNFCPISYHTFPILCKLDKFNLVKSQF